MTTTEKNKLIDLFMESKGEWVSYKDMHGGEVWGNYKPYNYHSSWDCLMPVVEKIESLGYKTSIIKSMVDLNIMLIKDREDNHYREHSSFEIEHTLYGNTKIEAVYNACVDFILWYNPNKS